jgi:hypothetical protein
MAAGEARESAKKGRHLRRNLVLLVVALLAISLFALVETGLLFGRYGCFGPCGTMPYISTVSCYSVTKTCQITLAGFTAQNVASLQALSCAFVLIPNDNATSYVLLSSSPHGPSTYVNIPPNSSVSVYCAYPRTPSSGQQVEGSVILSNGYNVEFSSTWN